MLCITLTSWGHETYCVQLFHRHGSPTHAASRPQHLPPAMRNQQISPTSSPPETLWALCNPFPWGCCIKSLWLLLNDTSGRCWMTHLAGPSATTELTSPNKAQGWSLAPNESPQQEHRESRWAPMNKSSSKGPLLPLPKGHKVTLQKQFLQVVTEHFSGEFDDSWSGQSIVRAAHRQAAVPGDVTPLWSEAERSWNTQCNRL